MIDRRGILNMRRDMSMLLNTLTNQRLELTKIRVIMEVQLIMDIMRLKDRFSLIKIWKISIVMITIELDQDNKAVEMK